MTSGNAAPHIPDRPRWKLRALSTALGRDFGGRRARAV
jgi:hypothetical protein